MRFPVQFRRVIAFAAWSAFALAVNGCVPITPPSQIETQSPLSSAGVQAEPPHPASPTIQGFVEQIDGEFGYRMLRPANWEPIHLGAVRGYRFAASAAGEDRLLLTVGNLAVMAAQASAGTQVAPWVEFQQSDSLEAWMQQREAAWTQVAQSTGLSFERYMTLPNGAVYLLLLPEQSLQLIAYLLDDGHPLTVSLEGFGAYVQRSKLEESGLSADFLTMLRSAQAIEPDVERIDPPLPQ